MKHIVIITETIRDQKTERVRHYVQRLTATSAKDAKRIAEALNVAFDHDAVRQRCAETGVSIHLPRGVLHLNAFEMETITTAFMETVT